MSASGRSGTAYGHIAKGSGADGLRQAHRRGTQLNNIQLVVEE